MVRNREIIKRGGSYYLKLSPIDLVDFNLMKGEFLDIELMFDKKKLRRKK